MARFVTTEKLNELFDWLENLGLDVLYIRDSEDHRDVNLKYLTGHPEDASLFIDVQNRQTVLIPWDYQLSNNYSEVDQVINIMEYDGGLIPATFETLKSIVNSNPKIGVPKSIPYFYVRTIIDQIPNAEIIYNPQEIDTKLDQLRSTKSPHEISLLKKSVSISNQLVEEMEELMNRHSPNNIETEVDLAIFVENRMRELGAFGTGFETLVASSKRSWQIHTYPRADQLSMYRPGLALIDFGVNAEGLTSDVTLPFIIGKMNNKMKVIVETVEHAHNEAIDNLREVNFLHEVAEVAMRIIESKKFKMPHGLGHGIGLTVHDSPDLRKKPTHEILLKNWTDTRLEEGMVFTIEPGIYEKDVGGFRLENDVIITSKGPQVITNSHPIFIDL
ncbi:MAG: aminopeptidase P family protein [Candidatus Heimdallarchaeota archaeon]|nr:MAG: aminopeptidase P family protein [Candidatus Heimdallarchaeota archaeon]